jgi:4-hydroxy-tetrahydrodipicolinate synthase
VGSESLLLANMRGGGKGCISATANVNAPAIAGLHRDWQREDADAQQAALDRVRAIFQRHPMIPALKAAVAHWSRIPDWRTVRPPLVELDPAQSAALVSELEQAGFSMPGLNA